MNRKSKKIQSATERKQRKATTTEKSRATTVTSSFTAPGVPYLGAPKIFRNASSASVSPLHRKTLPLAHPRAGLTTDITSPHSLLSKIPAPILPLPRSLVVADDGVFGTWSVLSRCWLDVVSPVEADGDVDDVGGDENDGNGDGDDRGLRLREDKKSRASDHFPVLTCRTAFRPASRSASFMRNLSRRASFIPPKRGPSSAAWRRSDGHSEHVEDSSR